jgi:hypothetical protein
MRATDKIRAILDLIDGLDEHGTDMMDPENNRFLQVMDLITPDSGTYNTQPRERTSHIDSVADYAGGGLNGPKHPDDLRVKDPRGFR